MSPVLAVRGCRKGGGRMTAAMETFDGIAMVVVPVAMKLMGKGSGRVSVVPIIGGGRRVLPPMRGESGRNIRKKVEAARGTDRFPLRQSEMCVRIKLWSARSCVVGCPEVLGEFLTYTRSVCNTDKYMKPFH
mmetsp:Transcript_31957/g.95697  ORF Transcript_31957/g.95697 Transcript_31957/m.95697 type:complete len:132 (+) Transcript_31957:1111-1506(+)